MEVTESDTYTSIVAYFVEKVNIENAKNDVLAFDLEMLMLEKKWHFGYNGQH